jgi:hypothetical protein
MKSFLQSDKQNEHTEEWQLFRNAVAEGLEQRWHQDIASSEPIIKEPSLRHKENMNREHVDGSFLPYPEENSPKNTELKPPMSE